MLRFVALWFAASAITAAIWSIVAGIRREEREVPENDDAVRERMERVRDAGSEVGL